MVGRWTRRVCCRRKRFIFVFFIFLLYFFALPFLPSLSYLLLPIPPDLQHPLVLVISLNDAKFLKVKQKLIASGAPKDDIYHVHGINGTSLNLEQLVYRQVLSHEAYIDTNTQNTVVDGVVMTPGAIGCYLSHTHAWTKVIQENRAALVLEDDVFIPQSFYVELLHSMSHLPRDWDLLYPASMAKNWHVYKASSRYSSRLYQMSGEMWGTYAYVVSPEGATEILADAFPARHQVDFHINYCVATRNLQMFRNRWNLLEANNARHRISSIQRHTIAARDGVPLSFHYVLPSTFPTIGSIPPSSSHELGRTGISVISHNLDRKVEVCEPISLFTYIRHIMGIGGHAQSCVSLGIMHAKSHDFFPSPTGLFSLKQHLGNSVADDKLPSVDACGALDSIITCLDILTSKDGGICISGELTAIGDFSLWDGLLWHLDAFSMDSTPELQQNQLGKKSMYVRRLDNFVLGARRDSSVLAVAASVSRDVIALFSASKQQRGTSDCESAFHKIYSVFQHGCIESSKIRGVNTGSPNMFDTAEKAYLSDTLRAERCRLFIADVIDAQFRKRTENMKTSFLNARATQSVLTAKLEQAFQSSTGAKYGAIPRIIHILWLASCTDISMIKYRCILSWILHHPGWEVKIWTQSDLEKLNLRLQPLIDAATTAAQKSDLARIELLARFGGVYVDTDLECLQNIEPLLDGASLVGCHEDGIDRISFSLSTGFIAVSRQHPTMKRVLEAYTKVVLNTADINLKTGPKFFRIALGKDIALMRIIPARWIYPVRYSERTALAELKCYEQTCHFFGAYAVHLFRPEGAMWTPIENQEKKSCDRRILHLRSVIEFVNDTY